MYYQIRETLTPCSPEDIKNRKQDDPPFVGIMNLETWEMKRDLFDMVIDMDMDPSDVLETKAIVNYDSLTGTFFIPRRTGNGGKPHRFAFALDENGIIFIENGVFAQNLIEKIRQSKKWRLPSLERFLYDFLEMIISRDLKILIATEQELSMIEEQILKSNVDQFPERLNEIRAFLVEMSIHYEQMIDLGEELEDNENGFFKDENLRYFRLFTDRVTRLMGQIRCLREYIVQLRELFSTQLDIRMNRIMTALTVITAIFMPLTLIVGWYGMNFSHMPELDWEYGYPVVCVVSVLILTGGIAWFRKKKWL